MPRPVRKWIVRLRMWYADIRGHHGKRWDYEPSKNYMRKKWAEKLMSLDKVFGRIYAHMDRLTKWNGGVI